MAATTYDVGDLVRVTATFGDDTDPDTVSVLVKAPNGTVTTYTYAGGTVTRSAAGVYFRDVSLTAAGTWRVRVASTGSGQAAQEYVISVRQQQVSAS